MRKASSKEEFDRKIAQDAEREQARRTSQSSMPPRSEWKKDSRPITLQDAYKPSRPIPPASQPKRSAEESMALALGLPPGDRLREQAKREYFGIVDEQTQIEQLEARIKELEKKNAN